MQIGVPPRAHTISLNEKVREKYGHKYYWYEVIVGAVTKLFENWQSACQ